MATFQVTTLQPFKLSLSSTFPVCTLLPFDMEKSAVQLESTSPQTRAFVFMMIIDSIILFSSLFHLTQSVMTLLSFLWTASTQLKSQRCLLGTTAETCITTNLNQSPESCSIPSILNNDEGVNISDLRMVLGRLGNDWHDNEKKVCWRANDITAMFEEHEPSVVEAKEAFDVFDENGDGFIDARELRRVLSRLGFHDQASSEANCKKMIRAYDENGDGLVDFHEFMKLLGNSFA